MPSGSKTPATEKPLLGDIAVVAFVQNAQLMRGLSDAQLGRLVGAGALLDYMPDAVIVSEGDTDDALFMIVDGTVSVMKGEQELAVLERAQIFGEMSVLTQEPRSATVVTRTDAKVVRLPGDIIRTLADEEPKLGRRLALLMTGRSKDTEKKVMGS